jgi:molecular chaperone DnaK (HSP70)
MSKVVGFDFGTTNSLISVVLKNGAIKSYTEDNGMPHPSVVCYAGEDIIAGRKAKERLDTNVMGISGDVVRSPKSLLDKDDVFVSGRNKHPVDIVSDLVKFLKSNALEHSDDNLTDFKRAVVTIPVGMAGKTRKALRNALLKAGMNVVKFVHEPLAALYGYFRQLPELDMQNELLKRNGQLVLVFDWGGGTLDLTLCKIMNNVLIQIQNVGDNSVGGDRIDEALLNFVLNKYMQQQNLKDLPPEQPSARSKLLIRCEEAKIHLSSSDNYMIYVADYFSTELSNDSDIDVLVTRKDLEEISRGIINQGIGCIKHLRDVANVDESRISLCVATGGMIKTPIIEQKLQEIFGLSRLVITENGDRIISEGAAWIAHDNADLVLAKTVEIKEARDSYYPIFKRGRKLPEEGLVIEEKASFYSVDPTDGFAKFQICCAESAGNVMAADPRKTYGDGNLTLRIDDKARPFFERLSVRATIDDNLILNVEASSDLNKNEKDMVEIHDLEFCVSFPHINKKNSHDFHDENLKKNIKFPIGAVTIRSNILRTDEFHHNRHENEKIRNSYVPGEVLYKFNQEYFNTFNNPPKLQVEEKLYYQPCAICKRKINDPACKCA